MGKKRGHLLSYLLLAVIFHGIFLTPATGQPMYMRLKEYCKKVPDHFDEITASRKDTLHRIGDFILTKKNGKEQAVLLFGDIHNAKVSQLAQLWFYVALHYYHIKNTDVFSGGLEPSGFDHRIVNPIQQCGIFITPPQQYTSNLIYFINLGQRYPDFAMFAKPIDYYQNPHQHYLLIGASPAMADVRPEAYGAENKIMLSWDDPTSWDDTPVEQRKYLSCSEEIARDMFYLANYIKKEEKVLKKKKRKSTK